MKPRSMALKPMSNRLVATTEFERREVADLKRKLVDFLETEAQLLPGFHPAHFEYDIPRRALLRMRAICSWAQSTASTWTTGSRDYRGLQKLAFARIRFV